MICNYAVSDNKFKLVCPWNHEHIGSEALHAREPLNSNSAGIAGGCSRRGDNISCFVHLAVEKDKIFLNILLLKEFLPDYCH